MITKKRNSLNWCTILRFVLCDTGPIPSNRGLMLLIYFNSNRNFSRFYPTWFSCYILTISYLRPSGVALSKTCSEIYCLQFWTPLLSLQHTCVLQAHCGENSDREFSTSQNTNFQYTYNIFCTLTFTFKCSLLIMVTVTLKCHCSLWSLSLLIILCSI